MADPQQQQQQQQQQPQQANALSATYPAPPPFYKHFTAENRARLKELQQTRRRHDSSDGDDVAGADVAVDEGAREEMPSELRYLVPPAPPTSGTYRNFGDPYNVIDTLPSLQEQGIEQLYPSPPDQRLQPQPQGQSHGQSQGQSQGQSEGQSQGQDEAPDEIPAGTDDAPAAATSMDGNGTQSEWTLDRAFYLQKIAKSLLLNFMELVGVLSVDPAQYASKIESLRTLFINAHHLLNEYRPHQARETLILMMEEQLDSTRRETAGIRRMKAKVEETLRNLGQDLESKVAVGGGDELDRSRGRDGARFDDVGGDVEAPEKQPVMDRSEMERQLMIWETLRLEFY